MIDHAWKHSGLGPWGWYRRPGKVKVIWWLAKNKKLYVIHRWHWNGHMVIRPFVLLQTKLNLIYQLGVNFCVYVLLIFKEHLWGARVSLFIGLRKTDISSPGNKNVAFLRPCLSSNHDQLSLTLEHVHFWDFPFLPKLHWGLLVWFRLFLENVQ